MSPEMINFFSYYIKKMIFLSSPKGTPTTGAVEQWEKPTLQWKPMELGGVPQKKDELYSKKIVFQAHLRLPPRPVSQNNEKKTALQWKPMELGCVPQKWMNLPLVFMVFHGQCQKI